MRIFRGFDKMGEGNDEHAGINGNSQDFSWCLNRTSPIEDS